MIATAKNIPGRRLSMPPVHSETNGSKSSAPLAGAVRRPDVVATAVAHRRPVPASRDLPDEPAQNPMRGWRLIACVLLPFAAGFFISYLFRSINALISGELTSDLGLGAGDLGLLTSVYFLTFAVVQIPIGVLLDRYGPRRVQSALLLVAAVGAAMFARSEDFAALVVARALIGLGVAAALTAGLKAIVQWFPKERVALANGCIVMLGALGAVTATAPAELLLASAGWRGLFELLAVATAGIAAVIYLVVPDAAAAKASKRSASVSLKTVYTDPRFWRLAPLSAVCAGSAWALQGLWAAPWLTDVEGVDRPGLVRHLFVMAVAVSAGSFLLGAAADRLGRRGIGPQALLAIVATVFIAAQLAPRRQKEEFFDLALRIGTSCRICTRQIPGQRAIESFCWKSRVAGTQCAHSMSLGGVIRIRENGYSTRFEPIPH
jgi:predicted MFS family arabinose efflux permease